MCFNMNVIPTELSLESNAAPLHVLGGVDVCMGYFSLGGPQLFVLCAWVFIAWLIWSIP